MEGYRGGLLNAKLRQQYNQYATEAMASGSKPMPIKQWMEQQQQPKPTEPPKGQLSDTIKP